MEGMDQKLEKGGFLKGFSGIASCLSDFDLKHRVSGFQTVHQMPL
jgi:hypothetical protein